jgi:hypothetical protein
MIIEKLAKLINVKTIITILLSVVFAILTLSGTITGTDFMTIFVMIITFYFTRRTETNEKETPLDNEISE